MVHQDSIEISTTGNGDMQDLTQAAHKIVKSSGIKTGMVHLYYLWRKTNSFLASP